MRAAKGWLMTASTKISGQTRFTCLLGNPTGHSLSPVLHNLSFELLGIDAVYLCFDVGVAGLGAAVAAFKAMERWDGFNVTMPCKQAVIPYLDGLDEVAELAGAVNVVKREAGRAVGCNTDGVGFAASLAERGVGVAGARIALLGPGGAGSAIAAQAALDGASRIDLLARIGGESFARAEELCGRLGERTGCKLALHDIANKTALRECVQAADILVNATPVGMGEGCEDSLVAPQLLAAHMAVADVVYHPRKTRLIRDAEAAGCVAVPGLGMLVEQAAAAEAIWYGARMPVAQVRARLFGE